MVGALDVKVYKTLNNLGGAITATQINSSTPNNLFTNVPNNERVIGEDYYACVYFKNGHVTESMNNFKLWLSDKSFPHDTEIKWGFDPSTSLTAQTIASKYVAPTGMTWRSLGGTAQTIPTAATPPLPTYHYEPYRTFNGTSNFIDVPDAPSLDLNQFTISAWFRTTKDYHIPTDDPGGEAGIILVKGKWGPPEDVNYGMWVTDANGLRGGFLEAGDIEHLAKSTDSGLPGALVNDGNWHLGIITYDGANVKCYVDAVLHDTRATSATPQTLTTQMRIGANNFEGFESVEGVHMYFKGDLDEVYVWNNDLTAGEIDALYSDGIVPQSGNVVYSNKFGADTNFPGDATPGNLLAGRSFPVWLWYHVTANAISRLDDSELFSFSFDIPQGGTSPPPPPPPPDGGGGGNPPPVNADYKVAFLADEGCTSTTDAVISRINTNAYNFVVSAGDHAYASSGCWTGRFSALKNAGKLNAAYGNHEYSESPGNPSPYKTFFGHSLTYFTFKFQNIQFFVIDTNINGDPGSAQHTFIMNALQQSQADNTVTWRIGVFHHPMFGASSSHAYNEANSVQNFHSLFITNKVSFVVAGHNHNWQRTHQVGYNSASPANPTVVNNTPPFSRNTPGIIHVVSGGGGHDSGSSLYSLGSQPAFNAFQNRTHNGVWEIIASNNAQTLTCSFVDKNGEKFDTFTINS